MAIVASGGTLPNSELRRHEAATPAQARSLLVTEGFTDPEVKVFASLELALELSATVSDTSAQVWAATCR